MVSRRLVVSSLVVLALLSSRPFVSRASAQPASVDACALYTRQEVESLAGVSTNKPRPSEVKFGTVTSNSCWTRASNSSWSVKINVERGRTSADLKQMLGTLKGVASKTTGSALKPVAGVGDEAYWGQTDPSHGMLHIVIGTSFLTVETWGKGPGAGTLDRTKEIATVVVKRFKEQYKG
jgi:hypothetical protein